MESSNETDFSRYLRLIAQKRVLVILTALAVTTFIVVISYMVPREYEARSMILIERNFVNDLIKTVTVTPSFEEKVKAISVVMKSRSLVMRVINDLDLDVSSKSAREIDKLVRHFQDKTDVSIEINKTSRKDMDLFIVSYTDDDPRRAANYVNALVRRYIEENLSIKRDEAYGANRFLLEQINSFKEKIDKAETSIAALKKGKSVAVSPDQQTLLEQKLNGLLMQYTENHPEVMKVKAEIEALKAQQRREKKAAGEAAPAAGDTAGVRRSLVDLERERDTNKKIYEELLSTLGKSEVSTQVEVQDKAGAFRILDPAIAPMRPSKPEMVKMIMFALLAGIAAGIGVIVAADMSDTSVKSAAMVKKIGLPVLAVIPTIRTEKETAAIKKRDRLLYALAGVYLTGILMMFAVEALKLPYLEHFVQGYRNDLWNAVKKIS